MSEIITFYSYKGGVGRTMALANVSVMLAKWGHKVLVVDWDLEAPGLEHFYKDYITIADVKSKIGVIDLLQLKETIGWKEAIIPVNIKKFDNAQIDFISSGKRDEGYFKKVRDFNVNEFYENDGGEIIEKLRSEWLENYDYVLIDSRTGITEIGGICTIQLPDIVVMLFTATDQGFNGVLDIMKRATAAQQKLPYDRQKLIFLPIPSKFETNTEFALSQQWLKIFADNLNDWYNDWLPMGVDKKDFLELTKIPYIPYFSFGEKLPVIEQGLKDPAGLGYAYETLAGLIGNHLNHVDLLISNRDQFIFEVNKQQTLESDTYKNGNSKNTEQQLWLLKQRLNIKDGSVQVVKSKEVVLNCIESSIVPLLNSISNKMNEIGSLFKNRKENIIYVGSFGVSEESNRSLLEKSIKLVQLYESINMEYIFCDNFDLISIIYKCSFAKLRNFDNDTIYTSFEIPINFYDVVYEIKTDDNAINFDKLYHDVLTEAEISAITEKIGEIILKKIDAAMKA